ncbi:DUF1338 domain-containing protein [Tistrella bauzanensis]|uniref:2-oxoadipate dioxygenase/decarboxylase n=1 Tax=Tistrella bauzanensis TaxID=657419 RepID=A0ABQ1J833_9PROT|nr:DUF1338 domain-containing protein [Tistrella bauzanensis]GGB62373.1 DUF1338 domain-containing protein [Tistrella bauzanensis]
MTNRHATILHRLIAPGLGASRADALLDTMVVHPALLGATGDKASRALVAQALNMLLFADLLDRVPAAAAYVACRIAAGGTVFHDHGAVRTVAIAGQGALPGGEAAILRILEPLGYARAGHYPLDRLKMTGRSYAQKDMPEDIAQFFISELHPERFGPEFEAVVRRVTGTARDPLTPAAVDALARLAAEGTLPVAEAAAILPVLVGCFDRQHDIPALADYEALKAASAEMAWIATEGNAFNHATDRVADVDSLAAAERAAGRPIKDKVEVSGSGRVRQTAYRAAEVARDFRLPDGGVISRVVPGSFYEFITRDPLPDAAAVEAGRRLDLGFDSSNAQGIFKMTTAA